MSMNEIACTYDVTTVSGHIQAQVDNGIPLPVCLRLFNEWVTKVEKDKDVVFLQPPNNDKHPLKQEHARKKLVAMATWSGMYNWSYSFIAFGWSSYV